MRHCSRPAKRLRRAPHHQQLLIARRGCCDHVRAPVLSQLHGDTADAAGAGVDEHALPRLDVGGPQRLRVGPNHLVQALMWLKQNVLKQGLVLTRMTRQGIAGIFIQIS